MAQDELTPEDNRAEPADAPVEAVSAADNTVNAAEPEAVEEARSPRDIAKEIFRTREFEGETLRMGQVLRRVREALGLKVEDVSRDTLLRKDYLMWIERMEVHELPGGGYLNAILNTYARYLGLPEREVITAYTQECGAAEEVRDTNPVPKIGEIGPERSRWPLTVAAAAVLVALGVGAVTLSQFIGPDPQIAPSETVVAVNGARESLFSEAATSSRPIPQNLPLEIHAVRQGWLEVRGRDGTIFRNRVMAAGESYFPRLEAGWTVSARDGGAFEWRVGDVSVAPLGPDGAQVFSVSVDEQLAAAADATAPAMASNGGSKATR